MKDIRTILYIIAVSAVLSVSCNSEQKGGRYQAEEYDANALPYGATDTIDGEKVSNECAIINNDLERLKASLELISSPSMLMTAKVTYQHDLDSLSMGNDNLTPEEASIIKTLIKDIATTYEAKCKEYEIPAEGVIDNLRRCIDRVNKTNNSTELIRFMEARRGMLMDLDYIHLCVDSRSNRIDEVRKLAAQLKHDLDRKKRRFGVN